MAHMWICQEYKMIQVVRILESAVLVTTTTTVNWWKTKFLTIATY